MPTYGSAQDYEGESDARTLSDGHAIRKDPKRHAKALGHLKKMAKKSTHAGDAHKYEEGSAIEEKQESPKEEAAEGGE